MKKMFSFKFRIAGIPLTVNVLAERLLDAEKTAYEKCADCVGDDFKQKALNGDYLKEITVTHVHVA